MEKTTIEITVQNWQWLTSQKRWPGESFNDLIDRLREQSTALEETADEIEPDTTSGDWSEIEARLLERLDPPEDSVAATDVIAVVQLLRDGHGLYESFNSGLTSAA